jgi:hypothetical protein
LDSVFFNGNVKNDLKKIEKCRRAFQKQVILPQKHCSVEYSPKSKSQKASNVRQKSQDLIVQIFDVNTSWSRMNINAVHSLLRKPIKSEFCDIIQALFNEHSF